MRGIGGIAGIFAMVMVVVGTEVQETPSSRILIVDLFGSTSHKHFAMAVAEELAQRNHSITYLTGVKPTRVRDNVREVYIQNENLFSQLTNLFNYSVSDMWVQIIPIYHKMCPAVLDSKEVKAIQQEKFDLVMLSIVTTECFLPFVHKMKVPVIYMTPNVLQGTYSDIAGTPFFPSMAGSIMIDQRFPFTFTGRLKTVLHDQLSILVSDLYLLPKTEDLCRSLQLCPDDVPSFVQLKYSLGSLLITNSVRNLEMPALPYAPSVIHAGGIHCRPANPLPQDLEEWVSGSGEAGFIFFSLGSIVKPSDMPEGYRSVLLKVFASLEQRVLWKWDQETMEGLPPNVRLSKWLPQQDVLGHSKLRLFMTHGGLLSLQEATYHGVPILGFPVIVDQSYNVRLAQHEGWGRGQRWEDLTYDTLRNNITEVMQDTRIREEVARRSRVMRDQPMSPGAWTTYWIEYVIRHRGATHLRCPSTHMPWYELYNVDVWVTLLVVGVGALLLISFLSYKCLRCVCSRCFARKKSKSE